MTEKTKSELNAEEREKITSQTNDKEEKEKEENKEEDKETEEDKEIEETEEDETEEDESNKEEIETKPSVEKLQKTIERLQRRVDKKTGNERQLQAELNAVKEQLIAREAETGTLTEEDVKAEAARLAKIELAEREFKQACDKLQDKAAKLDKKFDEKINALAEDIGKIPSQLIGMLDDLDNGAEILVYLTDNIDEAEKIWGIASLAKQSIALTKLSVKLEAEAKAKKIKKISNAPPAKETIKGGTAIVTFDPSNTRISDKEWIEQRQKQVAEKNAAKRASMR